MHCILCRWVNRVEYITLAYTYQMINIIIHWFGSYRHNNKSTPESQTRAPNVFWIFWWQSCIFNYAAHDPFISEDCKALQKYCGRRRSTCTRGSISSNHAICPSRRESFPHKSEPWLGLEKKLETRRVKWVLVCSTRLNLARFVNESSWATFFAR